MCQYNFEPFTMCLRIQCVDTITDQNRYVYPSDFHCTGPTQGQQPIICSAHIFTLANLSLIQQTATKKDNTRYTSILMFLYQYLKWQKKQDIVSFKRTEEEMPLLLQLIIDYKASKTNEDLD